MEKATLQKLHLIPAENVFDSDSGAFARGVLRATKGEGVGVVLNLADDDAARPGWLCVSEVRAIHRIWW